VTSHGFRFATLDAPPSYLVRQMGRLMEFVAALILQYTSHRRDYVSPFLLAISDPRSSRHCICPPTALYKMARV
jgi:hypothetical protein